MLWVDWVVDAATSMEVVIGDFGKGETIDDLGVGLLGDGA
jgi:hypothetical protein